MTECPTHFLELFFQNQKPNFINHLTGSTPTCMVFMLSCKMISSNDEISSNNQNTEAVFVDLTTAISDSPNTSNTSHVSTFERTSSIPVAIAVDPSRNRSMTSESERAVFLQYWIDWFSTHVSSIRPTSRVKYATLLYENNVTTEKRLVNKLQNKEWLLQIGVDELDSSDIVDYIFANGSIVVATSAPSQARVGIIHSELIFSL